MKKLIFYFAISFLLFSCVSVEFTSPQPSWEENLSSFPVEMHGTYYSNENDTFEIGSNYYKIVSTNENTFFEKNENQMLSDSMQFKQYGNLYFLNVMEKENWTVSTLKLNRNKSISIGYIVGTSEELTKKLDFVSDKKFLTDENDKVDRIILNPTKKEFRTIVKKKLFEESLLLTRIPK